MLPFIHIFSKPVAVYGLCIATGIFISIIIAYFLIKSENKSFDDFAIYAAVVFGTGMLGAKLLFIFLAFPFSEIPQQLWYLLTDARKTSGGFVFYGGLISSLAGFFIAKKITKKPVSDFLPVFAAIIPVTHAFGRIGCFCAGCCYGIPYDGIFAVHYHNPISSVTPDIGIFPVQLLEALVLLILGAILISIRLRLKKATEDSIQNDITFGFAYLIPYSIIRFLLEFLRGDSERGFFWIFSTSQLISVLIVLISILTIIILKKKTKL